VHVFILFKSAGKTRIIQFNCLVNFFIFKVRIGKHYPVVERVREPEVFFQSLDARPRRENIPKGAALETSRIYHLHKNVGQASHYRQEDDDPNPHRLAPISDTMDYANSLQRNRNVVGVIDLVDFGLSQI
jgi:hypothetical protein